ncbi:hypothetical protein QBC35DRAFT_392378, partial [Podospora australis]
DRITVINRATLQWREDMAAGKPVSRSEPFWMAKIIGFQKEGDCEPVARVRWYYRPQDLPTKRQHTRDCGPNTVFYSDHGKPYCIGSLESC